MVIPSAPIRVVSVRYTGTGLSVSVYRNLLKGQNSVSVSLTKMAAREEDEFIVVRNERGKASIWKHFGFKNRKTDNTIVDNIAVCNS